MKSLEGIRKKINAEIASNDEEIRAEFFKHFNSEIESFKEAMAFALQEWRSLDTNIQDDENLAYVSGLVHAAVTLHLLSLKLLLSGHTVASGNLMRQVLETIALALLCSGKNLGVLELFVNGKYRSNNAIRDVKKHSECLMVNPESIEAIAEAQKFYHKYSHPSLLTLTAGYSFHDNGLYVGASFDEGKLANYSKEINLRVAIANRFLSFIHAVKANLSKW